MKDENKKRKLEALNEAASKYKEAMEGKTSKKHGTLDAIVQEMNEKYNLQGENEIRKQTVRSR